MPYSIKYAVTALLLQFFSINSALAEHGSSVELMHWWVSKGEQASIGVLQQRLSQQSIDWQAQAHAGSGTSRYGDILIERVAKGQPPTASQVIGYDIQKWATQGMFLSNSDQYIFFKDSKTDTDTRSRLQAAVTTPPEQSIVREPARP